MNRMHGHWKLRIVLGLILAVCLTLAVACASGDDDDDAADDDAADDDTGDDDVGDDDDDDADDDDDDDDDQEPIEHEYSLKTYSHSAVLPYLPQFAERGFRLYLGIRNSSIGSQTLIDVLTQCDELGIPVTACTAPSTGSFPNEETVDSFEENTHEVLDWTETVTDAVDTISVNMELGPPMDHLIQEAWANRDFELLIDLLSQTMDREMYLESVARYQQIVHDLQDRGYQVQITTFPFLVDDIPDGDTDLQDICNSPMTGIDWDLVAPCAYSTEDAHYLGTFDTSPYFVYSYSLTARELYGDQAVVDVGLVRTSGNNGYQTPGELAADIAAAKGARIKRIEIFKFGGMLEYEDYDFDDWADATLVEPAVPESQGAIDLARFGTGVIDFVLGFMD